MRSFFFGGPIIDFCILYNRGTRFPALVMKRRNRIQDGKTGFEGLMRHLGAAFIFSVLFIVTSPTQGWYAIVV